MSRRRLWRPLAGLLGLMFLAAQTSPVQAATISVPNQSFESPPTNFVSVFIDSWQEAPKPPWFVEDPEHQRFWTGLAGIFLNTEPGSADHIENLDGDQALYLIALPEVAIFQDYDTTDYANPTPTHAFDAKFEVGSSYDLTVGVIGNLGGMSNGVTLEISLYYRDAASNQVTVSATTITNEPGLFPDVNHFIDFTATVPEVAATDPWAGQNIGIRLLSTVGFELQGGYWDLDNIRLTATRVPALAEPAFAGGEFAFALQSEPGSVFDILASPDVTLPLSNWTTIATVTNDTGRFLFTDPAPNPDYLFYRTRQVP